MGRDDIRAALEGRQPPEAVPIWELEFHAWDQVADEHVVLGQEFCVLSHAEQERALEANAEILLSASLHQLDKVPINLDTNNPSMFFRGFITRSITASLYRDYYLVALSIFYFNISMKAPIRV